MRLNTAITNIFFLLTHWIIYLGTPFILKSQGRTETVAMDLYFGFNKYKMESNQIEKVTGYAEEVVKLNAQVDSMAIYGLTDTFGTKAYNKRLAYRRCKEVDSLMQSILHRQILVSFKLIAVGEAEDVNESDSLKRKASIVLYITRTDSLVESIPKLVNLGKNKGQIVDLPADKVLEVDTLILLDNVYFRPDSPDITPESLSVLQNYKYLIKKYPNNFIEVGGHVNHTFSKLKPGDPLFTLSEERAKVIMEYFVQNGFNPNQITCKGYGNSKLAIEHPGNLAEKMKNMRVELRIFKSAQKINK